jgi:hypothetical protein
VLSALALLRVEHIFGVARAREVAMANKEQKRSSREAKKPKKKSNVKAAATKAAAKP